MEGNILYFKDFFMLKELGCLVGVTTHLSQEGYSLLLDAFVHCLREGIQHGYASLPRLLQSMQGLNCVRALDTTNILVPRLASKITRFESNRKNQCDYVEPQVILLQTYRNTLDARVS